MRIIFDHTHGFGKMANQSFIYAPAGAVVEKEEEAEALENGWFPMVGKLWFQTRSTRINIEKFFTTKEIEENWKKIKSMPDINFTPDKKKWISEIYSKYTTYKNFKTSESDVEDLLKNSHGLFHYSYENKIRAFTLFKTIKDNFLSLEFAWDYEDPKLTLGHVARYNEYLFCKQRRYKYMYLSSGYESCSLYKSIYPGFEWWTGMKWSDDAEHFRRLCYSDDKVKIDFDWEKL